MTGLVTAYVVARLLGLDPGYAGGLLAGGLTQSPAIGSAGEAIARLPLEADQIRLLTAHVAVGYAVCYVVGSAGAIWFCSYMGPKLLGIDLQAEAAELGRSLGIDETESGVESGYRQFQLRAYRTPEGAPIVGRTLAEAERRFADQRLFVLRLRRGDQVLDADGTLVVEAGDVLAISGPRAAVLEHLSPKAEEVEDVALLDIPFQASSIVFSNCRARRTGAARHRGERLGARPLFEVDPAGRPGYPRRAGDRAGERRHPRDDRPAGPA